MMRLATFLLCLVPCFSLAQADITAQRRANLLEGTHAFRRILFDHRLRPLKTFEELSEEPGKTLLVVLGNLDALGSVPEGLETFVRGGGAVLLASDRAVTDEESRKGLLAVAGVTIFEDSLACLQQPFCYRGMEECPCLVQLAQQPPLLAQIPLPVYTNLPARLRIRRRMPGSVRPLAILPPDVVIRLEGGVRRLLGEQALVGVAGEVGSGRVVVLADHSVFINQMMLPEDTGNVEFAYNTVNWLTGEGKRDRVLFVENGRVSTAFEIPLKSIRIPVEEALAMLVEKRNNLLVEGERWLTRLEDDDFFNRKLLDGLAAVGLSPTRIWRIVLVVLSLLALFYGIYRVGLRGRFHHDATISPLAQSLDRALPVEPLARQRVQALVQSGQMLEPAVVLLRRWFTSLGVELQGEKPALRVGGSWWERRRLLGRLLELWQLAAGRKTRRVSAPEVWKLERELDDLRTRHVRGDWGPA